MMEVDCPRLQHPVVLLHGLGGFRRVGLGPWTLVRYFRGIASWMRLSDNTVMETKAHPWSGMERRSRMIAAEIDNVFPDQSVHLIGHSMGGLDARELAATWAGTGRILSITTIGTPHLGSTVADKANTHGSWMYPLFSRLQMDYEGFVRLKCSEMREFHESHPEPAGVHCLSVAGVPDAGQVCLPLRPFHALLSQEGPNDGLVSETSALAFGTPLPNWPLDHLRQVNWATSRRTSLERTVFEGYAHILERLVALGHGVSEESA